MRWVLVTLCSDDWVDQAKQLFASVYFDGNWRDDFCLMAYRLSDENKQWFLDRGIDVYDIEQIYNTDYYNNKSKMLLLKHNLFSNYFKKWDYVFFLDSDIICLQDLNEIKHINLEKKPKFIGAVKSDGKFSGNIQNYNRSKIIKDYKSEKDVIQIIHRNDVNQSIRLKINVIEKIIGKKIIPNKNVFNTGVLVFSTNFIEDGMVQDIKDFTTPFADIFITGDQIAFNLLFYDKVTAIDRKWNCMGKEVLENAVIRHFIFTGEKKPWEMNGPFRKKWNENLKRAEEILII